MPRIRDDEICPCGSGRLFGDCHGLKIRERLTAQPENHISLTVIPKPTHGTRSVLEKTDGDSIIFNGAGSGPDSLDCGQCGAPLAVCVRREQFARIVLRCIACGSYNDT